VIPVDLKGSASICEDFAGLRREATESLEPFKARVGALPSASAIRRHSASLGKSFRFRRFGRNRLDFS
jgi:hypothetical protein